MTNYITKTIKNGVEANIPVTSVNGQYGDVVVAWKEYTAWEWIEIKNWPDYSAMKWPAPSGFHVPSNTEWTELIWILTNTLNLSSTRDTMKSYLKMPCSEYRASRSWDTRTLGYHWYYWASTQASSAHGYSLYFDNTSLLVLSTDFKAQWNTLRCFKNSPAIPTSSWTTLYDWSSVATGAWIFWNNTEWLISISWDWTNWITIADKNLWATTVYNDWDTFSEANCGNYYQRWNNYWFPFTWTVTTSSTQVDASTYWPWNYYLSDTFITVSGSRSNPVNDNLRWWVTWVVTLDNAISNTGVLSVNGQTGDVSNVVTWDSQYIINVSTTAPASWTASNIITIVTD